MPRLRRKRTMSSDARVPTLIAVIVMGVSGSGKSTIAALLANRLGWAYADADWFHPAGNVEKMHAGHPLTDEDRLPWLEAIVSYIEAVRNSGSHCAIACSALTRAYRDFLARDRDDIRLVYLKGRRELIARRMALRTGHFMPASLLDSQFETLEEPAEDEHAIVISIEPSPAEIVDAIVAKLDLPLIRSDP
jgi:gluconokinase